MYFTPPISLRYAQQNRPMGIMQWLSERDCGRRCVPDGEVLVVMDPDMLFLRPLTNDPNLEKTAALQRWPEDPIVARPGRPLAQGYGIGPFQRLANVCVTLFGFNKTEGCQRWQHVQSAARRWAQVQQLQQQASPPGTQRPKIVRSAL